MTQSLTPFAHTYPPQTHFHALISKRIAALVLEEKERGKTRRESRGLSEIAQSQRKIPYVPYQLTETLEISWSPAVLHVNPQEAII